MKTNEITIYFILTIIILGLENIFLFLFIINKLNYLIK